MTKSLQKIVLFVLLAVVIVRFAAIITPKPQNKGQAEFGGATLVVVLNLVQDLVF